MIFDFSDNVMLAAGFQTYPEWVYEAPAQNAPIEQPQLGAGSDTAITIQGHIGN